LLEVTGGHIESRFQRLHYLIAGDHPFTHNIPVMKPDKIQPKVLITFSDGSDL